MNYWLLKSEPGEYSFSRLVAEKKTLWTGIRNFAARKHLRAMENGDLALFFHTGEERAVVGLAKVVGAARADPTAPGEDWSAIELAPLKAVTEPVPLAMLKATRALAKLPMLKQGRLSVSPVGSAEWIAILSLAKTKL